MPTLTHPTSPLDHSHPIKNETPRETAEKTHRLLLSLSRESSEKELSSAYRAAAEFFRERYFGLTTAKIRSKIINCLEDYFDGEVYTALEIENISEATGIKEEILLPVILRLVEKEVLICGRRRRWNELGNHYNPIYKLNK